VLRILSPTAGQTVVLPAIIQYVIIGIPEPAVRQCKLQVRFRGTATPVATLALPAAAGRVQVPDTKREAGQRDVIFTLVDARGYPLGGPTGTVSVTRLKLIGRR
jgi:hypothetical protein